MIAVVVGSAHSGSVAAQEVVTGCAATTPSSRQVRIGDPFEPIGLRWQTHVLHDVGKDETGPSFYRVAGAAFVGDGELVVADQGTSQLLFFSADGTRVKAVGQQGEGPGDHAYLVRVSVAATGSVFAYDAQLRRVTFRSPEGELESTLPLSLSQGASPQLPLVYLPGRTVLGIKEERVNLPPGLHRSPLTLLVAADSADSDVRGTLEGKEFVVPAGLNTRLPVGFAKTTLYSGRGHDAAVATTDRLQVRFYKAGDFLYELCGERDRQRPVLQADRESWVDHYVDGLPMPAPYKAEWRRRMAETTIRDVYPALGAMEVGVDGQLWLGEYVGLSENTRTWTVLDPGGEPIGQLRLPVYRPIPLESENTIADGPTHELLDVTSDRIAVLRVDVDGNQFVEIRQLETSR